MFIEYSWMTVKKLNKPKWYGIDKYSYKKTWWHGWFLFGIIPIFVRPFKVEYK